MPVWFGGILLYNGRFVPPSNRHETDLDVSGVLQPVPQNARTIKALSGAVWFELDIVDVDEDPVLEEKYNELVPVLLDGDTEIAIGFGRRKTESAFERVTNR